jgi:hypothetical protein
MLLLISLDHAIFLYVIHRHVLTLLTRHIPHDRLNITAFSLWHITCSVSFLYTAVTGYGNETLPFISPSCNFICHTYFVTCDFRIYSSTTVDLKMFDGMIQHFVNYFEVFCVLKLNCSKSWLSTLCRWFYKVFTVACQNFNTSIPCFVMICLGLSVLVSYLDHMMLAL